MKNGLMKQDKPKLLQKFDLSKCSSQDISKMEGQLDLLKSIKNPATIFDDYYKRQDSKYYVTSEYLG